MPVAHREITKKHIKRIAEEEAKKNSGSSTGLTAFQYNLLLIRVEDGKLIPNHNVEIVYYCDASDPTWLTYGKEIEHVTDIMVDYVIPAGDYLVLPSQGTEHRGWYIHFPYLDFYKNEDGELIGNLGMEYWTPSNDIYPILTDWKFKDKNYIDCGIVNKNDAETVISNAPSLYGTDVLTLEEDIPDGIYHFQDTSGYFRTWKEINFNESEENKNETE